jgi:hypothetical protein
MSGKKGLKNKLFKGLTEHDVLTWEEEKMRYQRRLGRKTTDLEFLRYLLMAATRPVISSKDGTQTGYLTGQGPIYEKADTLLSRFRSHSLAKEMVSSTQQKTKPRETLPE